MTGGGETVINEEALPTGTLRGRPTDENGDTVAGAGVSVTDPNNYVTDTTGEDGSYEITVLTGTYKTRFSQPDVRALSGTRTVNIVATHTQQ